LRPTVALLAGGSRHLESGAGIGVLNQARGVEADDVCFSARCRGWGLRRCRLRTGNATPRWGKRTLNHVAGCLLVAPPESGPGSAAAKWGPTIGSVSNRARLSGTA